MRTTFQDEDIGEIARKEARRRKISPTLLESLSRWWQEKFRLPSTHELFQNSTLLELLTEFWLDQYYRNPLEAYRNADGQVQFIDTGDELIDKWERELAEGKVPDYNEAFSPEQLETLERLRTRGTDRFGKSVPRPSSTLLDTASTVMQDAVSQGLLPQRFPNLDSPE